MPEIYANSDVLVYPSYYEELGYAVLEAMSYGLAVICSDIPSFRDIIIHEENGFLMKPEDYRSLASYLTVLSNDEGLLRKMRTKSLEIVKDKFSYKVVLQKLKDLLSLDQNE